MLINVKAEPGLIRNETFQEQDHIVIPMVGLVEGVMVSANSEEPSLALAEEFGKHVAGWNGRPVVINHPKDELGNPVSANSPEVLEKELIGQLFNASIEDKKLKFEAWINISTAEEKGDEGKDVITRLRNGELMEISTGLFANDEKKSGKHFGVAFNSIWRNVVPDHLALLPNGIGACSIADGCGAPRVNEGEKFCCAPCSRGEPCVKEQALFSKFLTRLGLKTNMTDSDVRFALQAALDTTSDGFFSFVHSVMKNEFVVETMDGFFRQSFKIKDDGTIVLGDEPVHVRPELNFVPVVVQKKHGKKEKAVNKEEKVNTLISSDKVPFDEEDRNYLDGLEEDRLDKFLAEPEAPEPVPVTTTSVTNIAHVESTPGLTPVAGSEAEPVTAEAYINEAPQEIQEVLQDAMNLRSEKRDHLTVGILTNDKNIFSEEELKAMSMGSLEKMAALAQVDDYSGRGGPRSGPTNVNSMQAPPPPLVFPVGEKVSNE